MTSRESDLVVVSLVRYADACDPAKRHSDCPFAVEREGQLSCHTECRSVITSLLRRGRPGGGMGPAAFDARQLRLSETPGAPDFSWHTSSLLQVISAATRASSLYRDGEFNLRRWVDATSALGVLGCRGFDPDDLIRRGFAKNVKLGLALWFGRIVQNPDDPRRTWKHFDTWRGFFADALSGEALLEDYFGAVLGGPTAQKLDLWINSAPIEDVLMWTPPGATAIASPQDPSDEATEIWRWIVERFTQTYLERWSLASLKREYAFMRGSWSPGFSTDLLADRTIRREDVTAALADRALLADDAVEPSIMVSFTDQALALLADGQHNAAAAIFNAARTLKPNDMMAQNNYAFCILIDRPQEARGLLADILTRTMASTHATDSTAVAWCNLAVAESLLGNNKAALNACEQAYKEEDHAHSVFLWRNRENEWVVEETRIRPWLIRFGIQLEDSIGTSARPWKERQESLSLLEGQETSSDPSSARTSEEDP